MTSASCEDTENDGMLEKASLTVCKLTEFGFCKKSIERDKVKFTQYKNIEHLDNCRKEHAGIKRHATVAVRTRRAPTGLQKINAKYKNPMARQKIPTHDVERVTHAPPTRVVMNPVNDCVGDIPVQVATTQNQREPQNMCIGTEIQLL